MLLFETYLPTRFYLPRQDVRIDLLVPGTARSHCPYKGFAHDYWDLPAAHGGEPVTGIAWSYTDPYPAVGAIAGRIAFYDELVDVEIDGHARPRPQSYFSAGANRPRTA